MSQPSPTPRDDVASQSGPPPTPAPGGRGTDVPPTQHQSVGELIRLTAGAEVVAGYRLVRPLGRGGFGEVWEATAPGDYRVALKFLRVDQQAGQVEAKHLQHLKDIRHGHLLPVFGAWEAGGYLILAMELADGTLDGRLRECRDAGLPGIPEAELFELMRDAARGIDYLNEKGIIHRDVKPANLLVVGGMVKVGDFGLAKLIDQSIAANSSGFTMAYAAPELFTNKLSPSVDQYALAVSYCELRCGKLPYDGTPHEVMFGHATGTPNLGDLPEAERPIVAKALAKTPSQRWASCREFVEMLASPGRGADKPVTVTPPPPPEFDPFLSANPPPTPTPVEPPPAAPPHRRPWLLAVPLAVAAGVGLAIWIRTLTTPSDAKPSGDQPPAVATVPTPAAPDPPKPEPQEPRPPAAKPAEPNPPPTLWLKPLDPVTLTAGESAPVTIAVEGENLAGELEIALAGAPAGVDIQPRRAPVGQSPIATRVTTTAAVLPGTTRVTVAVSAGGVRAEQDLRLEIVRTRPPILDSTAGGVDAAAVKKLQQDWAAYLGRKVEEEDEIAPGVKMAFVLIPPGKFLMGSPPDEEDRSNDETQHQVTITKPFYLAKYAVTQEQYEAVTGNNPSHFKGANLPVEQVSWTDADAYRTRLTDNGRSGFVFRIPVELVYRLPTEAEWEYACRGGRSSNQPFGIGDGASLSSSEANFDGNYPYGGAAKGEYGEKTTPVGSFRANALGLYDMHGNVWQWCSDWYGDYPSGSVTDPPGPETGASRVIRGGGWGSVAWNCRSARRRGSEPGSRIDTVGFRLARVPSGLDK